MSAFGLGTIVAILAAFWVAIAAVLMIVAGRRVARAAALADSARSVSALLRALPARPLLVHPDGRIEADRLLQRDLGLDSLPTDLDALAQDGGGLERDDLAALIGDIQSAALGGAPVARQARIAGSSRVVEVRGGLAPAPYKPNTLLLWVFDTTGSESERLKLANQLHMTEAALDSLTHLIESAPFPMWYRGPDMSLGLVNSAFVAAVEARDAAEVIARGSELIDSPGEESATAGAIVALETGRPYIRTQPATIGGERRMLKLVDVPLPTGAVAGFALDIQDLEDARFELARNIVSQRELADRMTAAVAQFQLDRKLVFFNQPFAVMSGIDPEWLAESPEFDRLLERMRENGRVPEVRDFPAWKNERRALFTSTEELLAEDWTLPNGDHWHVVAQPLPDGGLRMIFEDRTEQVRLASARDTLLRVRTATFDNLFEIISVFAADGRLYLWNRRFSSLWELDEEWLTGHPRVDELVPAMARKLVNPTEAAQVREMVRDTTTGRRSGTGRLSMTDGRHFEFTSVPLPDGNALFTMIDVTDSARIEAALRERATALEEADRVKTDFVANMSYELRTPLTSIGGFAQMLAQGYAGKLPPAATDYVAAILESVERLAKLINDVLDLTQGDRSGVVLERERVDMAGLCRAAAESIQARAAEKQLAFKIEIDSSTGVVVGDSRRLRESVDHVLRNAVAYTPEKGHIILSASGDKDAVTVSVADDGAGITAEDQQSVFNRFHRAVGAQRGEAALGLGLPLTRQFIEAHGGKVELQSEVGKGTAVHLVVPRAPQ
ncbi:PAS domain-containing sensor histidine kinase [Sphingomonas mesophila]|uniref:PAS domain-containing sensor histidine kinase n=1 Tax=Sphingomonas mesophila TaxID=2303576 RepID=UPI000E58A93B|nr:PAS domain-containing sensor histidine kinase [Sphingomonas mesophila]